MLRLIGDLYYKVSGLHKVQASLGYEEKHVALASFPRFRIIIYYSPFCDYNFYITALTMGLAYNYDVAVDTRQKIKIAGSDGYTVFEGNAEVTEFREERLNELRLEHNEDNFRYRVMELGH